MPTPAPQPSAISKPGTIIGSAPSMIFMDTAPASVIVAGIERSTLPGPRVMTYICPIATRTEKVANDSAAVSTSPAPWPCVKAMVASQIAIAPAKAPIHGFDSSLLMRRAPPG